MLREQKGLREKNVKGKTKNVWFPALLFFLAASALLTLLFLSRPTHKAGEEEDFRCSLETAQKKYRILQGSRISLQISIKNTGRKPWISSKNHPFALSYHVLDSGSRMIRLENKRYPLPGKILPGQVIALDVPVHPPFTEGRFILEFDIVKEGITWFKDQGSKPLRVTVRVDELTWPDIPAGSLLKKGSFTYFSSSIPEINTLYKLIRLTLERNAVTFKGRTGTVSGFSAGSSYPQIWLRDANTIIPASRCFYGMDYLASWLEAHLADQQEDGSLYDWLDSRGHTDKNTTETDQEASAVQAAYQITQIIGPGWLNTSVRGLPVITRLEKALGYVDQFRRDPKYGLIKGAHTADWGDVDMVDAGPDAVYVDTRTHWTADIYDQSMFYEASSDLSRLFEALGQKGKALFWNQKAKALKTAAIKHLWMKDRGYFRVHIHLDDWKHPFDEDNMFALGGNAQAVISDLADETAASRIIQEACRRQENSGVSTISGTLYPPYPKGTFRHPLLDDPYEYQNGAQWDWFGGRLIQAMFEHGFSRQAREKLLQILRKNTANGGFYEWDTKEGVGKGSDYFTGSAGVLGKDVMEEYFGLKLTRDTLAMEPKLGRDSGRIHVYLPAADLFAAYEYSFDPDKGRIRMTVNSNCHKKGTVKILCPVEFMNLSKGTPGSALSVLIDGKEVDFSINKQGQDTYIHLETNFARHTITISLKDTASAENRH